MRVEEFVTKPEIINEHEMVFSRTGNKLKTKWRCTSGNRRGRVVGNAKDCDAPIDICRAPAGALQISQPVNC